MSSNYALPPLYLSLLCKQSSYAGAKLFNLLREELKKIRHHNKKKQLTTWLLERPFYAWESTGSRRVAYTKKNGVRTIASFNGCHLYAYVLKFTWLWLDF